MALNQFADAVLKISLSICLLGLTLFFIKGAERNYAYLDYEGGYVALGYIYRQDVYLDAKLVLDGDVIADEISQVRNMLQDQAYLESTLVSGLQLEADAGLEWIGSETDSHKLKVHELKLESEGSSTSISWLNSLEQLEKDNLADYESVSSYALRYEKAPGGSFLISKLLAAIREYL